MSETRPSLLDAVRNRADARAWREFDAIYRPLILSYARNQGLGHDDAHEVVQEVFVKLSRTMVDFRYDPGRGRFRTWLYSVSIRAVYDRWRSDRRRRAAEAGRPAPPEYAEESEMDQHGEWMDEHGWRVMKYVVDRVRLETNSQTWACFERHGLKRRPAGEVAKELGVPINTVYVNTSRVLARVRDRCREFNGEVGDDAAGLHE